MYAIVATIPATWRFHTIIHHWKDSARVLCQSYFGYTSTARPNPSDSFLGHYVRRICDEGRHNCQRITLTGSQPETSKAREWTNSKPRFSGRLKSVREASTHSPVVFGRCQIRRFHFLGRADLQMLNAVYRGFPPLAWSKTGNRGRIHLPKKRRIQILLTAFDWEADQTEKTRWKRE